jgi:hypothetical protein
MNTVSLLCAALLLGGCATNFEAPPLKPDHPASPEAAEGRRVHQPRLVADALTRKTNALIDSKHAPDPDYHPTDAGTKPAAAAQAYWTCVMHPEIHADKPGQCPKCGMVLVKKERATE